VTATRDLYLELYVPMEGAVRTILHGFFFLTFKTQLLKGRAGRLWTSGTGNAASEEWRSSGV